MRLFRFRRLMHLLFLSAVLASPVCRAADEKEAEKQGAQEQFFTTDLSRERAENFIRETTDYLIRYCDAQGHFSYLRYPDIETTNRKADKYNILRHAGSVYSLWTSQRIFPKAETLSALERSVSYLRLQTGLLDTHANIRCLWSDRSESRDRNQLPGKRQAKLGGAGLAIIAMCGARKFLGEEKVPLAEIQGLANFVLFMQKADGSFFCKYLEVKGRDDRFVSLYYPGEVMLGLLMLNEIAPDEKYVTACVRGMEYLANSRKASGEYPPDHWAVIATPHLVKQIDENKKLKADRALIVEHGKRLCFELFGGQVLHCGDHPFSGAFDVDARTCPASTRLEGLIASLPLLEKEEPRLARLVEESIQFGICFIERHMIRSGSLRGGLPRSAQTGGARDDEVRIDYVQHALCAMAGYLRIVEEKQKQ